MQYGNLSFWVLTGILFLACRKSGMRIQNILLLLASLFFYGHGRWFHVVILLLSASIDFLAAPIIRPGQPFLRRRAVLAVSVMANLSLLAYFKYFGFLVTEVAPLFGLHIESAQVYAPLIFPLGISFYTFQAMSYTIDSYRGKVQPCRSYFDYLLYITFFPQLVAGPIEKASTFLPQFLRERKVEWSLAQSGLILIAFGLLKKFFIADSLGDPVNFVFQDPHALGPEVFFASWLMAIRVYFDFSAYSDIGRGIAKLFGIELSINFKSIWPVCNPTQFWERWNITTGRWFRDYVLIPIGGNGKSRAQMAINMIFMFVLIGFWHGASWSWLAWGACHGIIVAIYRDIRKYNPHILHATPAFVGVLFIQLFLLPAGGFLHMTNVTGLGPALELLTRDWTNWVGVYKLALFCLPPILVGIFLDLGWSQFEKYLEFPNWGWVFRTAAVAIFIGIALFYSRDPSGIDFVYFAF